MKKKMTILAALVLAVVVTAYSVSGTYAKYTSTFTGTSDSARVAKWAFKLNDADATETFNFEIFDTINEADTTTTEDDVASKGTDTVIAPGTGGSFDIKLTNDSEVTAKYAIDYTITNADSIPLEFAVVKDGEELSWKNSIDDLDISADNAKNIAINGSDTVTVKWRWAFNGDDTKDTDLGKDGIATVQVQAVVTVTQVD